MIGVLRRGRSHPTTYAPAFLQSLHTQFSSRVHERASSKGEEGGCLVGLVAVGSSVGRAIDTRHEAGSERRSERAREFRFTSLEIAPPH